MCPCTAPQLRTALLSDRVRCACYDKRCNAFAKSAWDTMWWHGTVTTFLTADRALIWVQMVSDLRLSQKQKSVVTVDRLPANHDM